MASLEIVNLVIERDAPSLNSRMEPVKALSPIPGSPEDGWPCREYRNSQATANRYESPQGTGLKDTMIAVAVQDLACTVAIDDIVTLTNGAKAKVIRVRPYPDAGEIQCDLETGTRV
jgi:hypothetical protein